MKVIKIQYTIGYYHMLSFADNYKKIINPFFTQPNLSYQIENEFTLEENIRLIFKDFDTIIQCRKDGMTMVFQGDEKEFVSEATNVREFFSILETIQKHEMFTKVMFHEVQVMLFDDKNIAVGDYLKYSPNNNITEFLCNYHFDKEDYNCNLNFGNFIPNDIKKHNLFLFKNETTDKLATKTEGALVDFRAKEITTTPSMNKLKNLLKFVIKESEKIL